MLIVAILIYFLMAVATIAILWLLYSIFIYFFIRVPFMATPQKYFKNLFKQLDVKNKTVYDLGCGTGTFLFAAEKQGSSKLIGFELSPLLIFYARLKAWLFRSKIKFVRQNFFKADFSQAQIIYLFLTPKVLQRTFEVVKKTAKSDTIIVSLSSQIPGQTFYQKIKADPQAAKESCFYLYKI